MALLADCEVFDCEQNSPEWYQARCGIVTASTFATVMAKGRGGGESEGRAKLVYSTAAEILTGKPTPAWEGNGHTKRGHEMEQEVRDLYEATSQEPVTRIGFIRRGRNGCSPDAAVGYVGGFEAKTKLPHLQLAALDKGTLPSEHVAQVQGILFVTGWQRIDFRSYWPGLPQLKLRVFRDIDYLMKLSHELQQFHADVDRVVAKYRS